MPDASTARSWINDSTLPDDDKAALRRFVDRFSTLDFDRDDDDALRGYEETDKVALPPWFRDVRATLAYVTEGALVRVSAFRFDESPRADEQADQWYEIAPGYINDENRETMHDLAQLYPIAQWFANDRSYLAIDLADPDDHRILEFAIEDLWDDEAKGEPLRESTFYAYASYADLLDHIVAVRLPNGTVIEAEEGTP